MNLFSSLCLFALILGVIAPLHPTIPLSPHNNEPVIFTLDVCHSQGAMTSGSSEMPSLSETPCKPVPLELSGFHEGLPPKLAQSIFAFRKERPPRS
jgi:hypothetical protein